MHLKRLLAASQVAFSYTMPRCNHPRWIPCYATDPTSPPWIRLPLVHIFFEKSNKQCQPTFWEISAQSAAAYLYAKMLWRFGWNDKQGDCLVNDIIENHYFRLSFQRSAVSCSHKSVLRASAEISQNESCCVLVRSSHKRCVLTVAFKRRGCSETMRSTFLNGGGCCRGLPDNLNCKSSKNIQVEPLS